MVSKTGDNCTLGLATLWERWGNTGSDGNRCGRDQCPSSPSSSTAPSSDPWPPRIKAALLFSLLLEAAHWLGPGQGECKKKLWVQLLTLPLKEMVVVGAGGPPSHLVWMRRWCCPIVDDKNDSNVVRMEQEEWQEEPLEELGPCVTSPLGAALCTQTSKWLRHLILPF